MNKTDILEEVIKSIENLQSDMATMQEKIVLLQTYASELVEEDHLSRGAEPLSNLQYIAKHEHIAECFRKGIIVNHKRIFPTVKVLYEYLNKQGTNVGMTTITRVRSCLSKEEIPLFKMA